MKHSAERSGQLYLAIADADFLSRDVACLAEIIRARTAESCRRAKPRR